MSDRTASTSLPAALAAVALIACGEGATSDAGYEAVMRVERAQFTEGPPPGDQGGPKVESIDLLTNTIWPGYADKLVQGALGEGSTSALLNLQGDSGYWIVLAGPPDVATPTLPSFKAVASFASALSPGPKVLEVRAVDGAGHVGAPTSRTLTALAAAPASAAGGDLVVSLAWDTEADLDLHVVDPLGEEIFHGAPISGLTFGPAPATPESPGVLDLDSNAGCVIDGKRRENVTWAKDPPVGHYLVRVDTPSLCGQAIAHYRVTVALLGQPVGEVAGVALDQDTWGPHDRGAGLLVLEFDVP